MKRLHLLLMLVVILISASSLQAAITLTNCSLSKASAGSDCGAFKIGYTISGLTTPNNVKVMYVIKRGTTIIAQADNVCCFWIPATNGDHVIDNIAGGCGTTVYGGTYTVTISLYTATSSTPPAPLSPNVTCSATYIVPATYNCAPCSGGGGTNRSSLLTNNGFQLKPNPATDKLNIELPSESNYTTLSIINLNGQVVMSKAIDSKAFELDINTLPSGMYLLKAEGEDKPMIEKFIKE